MSHVKYVTRRGYVLLINRIEETEKKLKNLQSQVSEQSEIGGNQWHDNAGYEQLVIDIRGADYLAAEARRAINNIEIVEFPDNPTKVCIGSRVTIEVDGREQIWDIVGYGESDVDLKRITYETPLAQKILGLARGGASEGVIGRKFCSIKVRNIESIPVDERGL